MFKRVGLRWMLGWLAGLRLVSVALPLGIGVSDESIAQGSTRSEVLGHTNTSPSSSPPSPSSLSSSFSLLSFPPLPVFTLSPPHLLRWLPLGKQQQTM